MQYFRIFKIPNSTKIWRTCKFAVCSSPCPQIFWLPCPRSCPKFKNLSVCVGNTGLSVFDSLTYSYSPQRFCEFKDFIILILWRWIWRRLYIWRWWRHWWLSIWRWWRHGWLSIRLWLRHIWRWCKRWLWNRLDIKVRIGRLILDKTLFRRLMT